MEAMDEGINTAFKSYLNRAEAPKKIAAVGLLTEIQHDQLGANCLRELLDHRGLPGSGFPNLRSMTAP